MPHVHTPQSFCRAGVGRADITPPVGIYHRMWGAATHDRSTGIHRPLTATVLVIRPMEVAAGVAVLSLDHCILGDADIAAIRAAVASETSIAAAEIHVCLSHTHGAGLMTRDRGALPGGDLIGPYLDGLASTLAALVRDAERAIQPAWITYKIGRCDLAADRDYFDERQGRFICGYNPHRPADDTLLVARVNAAADDAILGTVVNYACHPTTLAWENTLISPDYPGAMREVVEQATGAPRLFLQGASGELGPREGFVAEPAVADRNGRRLGYAALSALESLPPPGTRFDYGGSVVSGAELGVWKHALLSVDEKVAASLWRHRNWSVDLRYRTDLPTLEETKQQRARLAAEEQAARARGDDAAARDLHARVEQADRQIMRLMALPPGPSFPLPVATWQVGDALWVCVAGEHYSLLQTSLRQRFPGIPILIATIANGWQPGYLPTAETYGKGIYQEIISMVEAGSLERVIAEVGEQIEKWFRQRENV